MKRRQWYRLHKWLGVGSGLALLAWCVSGIAMVLPHVAPSVSALPSPEQVGPRPDYNSVTVSPAQAASALAASGITSTLNSVSLRLVGTRVAYEIRTENGSRALVDARTAEPFTIDSVAAVELARFKSGSTAEVVGFTLIESPNAKSPWGDFPGYTVEFADSPQLSYTASIGTGEVMRSAPVSRIRVFVENVHTFRQLGRFMPDGGIYWTLVLFTLFTSVAALIGFWIAIPRTWLPRALGGLIPGASAASPDDNYQGDR